MKTLFYDSFKNIEDIVLFNKLFEDLSSKFTDLHESLKIVLSKSEFLNHIFEKMKKDIQKFKSEPNIHNLHRIGVVMVDFNIITNIVNNPNIKKFVVFAGVTHIDTVRYFLKDCLGYAQIYSTDSNKTHVTERTWEQYCHGFYAVPNKEGISETFYIVSDLPNDKDFDYIN